MPTWSVNSTGAAPVPPFGFTNLDITASSLIGNFFQGFCNNSVGINQTISKENISIYPNPASEQFKIG
jgi:hypothetical protein